MLRSLLASTVLLVMIIGGSADHVRRRDRDQTKGLKNVARGLAALSTNVDKKRNLKGPYGYYYPDSSEDYEYYDMGSSEEMDDYYGYDGYDGYGGYSKKKSKSKGKRRPGGQKRQRQGGRQKCKTVVEPAEFFLENAIEEVPPEPAGDDTVGGNATDDSETGDVGTQYIFQGPLFDDDFDPLRDYFVSGVCTRTWNATDDLPGSALCQFTLTLETGAAVTIAGEVFDEWRNVLAITGGTFELVGIRGQVVLVAVDDNGRMEGGDFFESDFLHGQATMVYEVCQDGYWDQLIVDDADDLEGATFPDPFSLEDSASSSS